RRRSGSLSSQTKHSPGKPGRFTRGQAWYMDLLCLAKGGKELLNSKGIDAAKYT
ncbi:hypothetical protein CSQ32_002911, partial [Salmonella enterica subsp. diarizonae]|nr:hypothetical protein [Salmonella enterica subsp. diarizonae]EDV3008767.1 hypothetical protein [Salmonella enterica subsp. diarizonae]